MKQPLIEKTTEINDYLKREMRENFKSFKVIEMDIQEHLFFKTDFVLVHKIIKDTIEEQKDGQEYHYLFVDKNHNDVLNKIVYSNNDFHLIYEPSFSRLSYFDSNFNFIGDTTGHNVFSNSTRGTQFDCTRIFDFKINFQTAQFKKISISINKENDSFFNFLASGKNKIKSIKFENEKNKIKASITNSFIKNIIFDLNGNVVSIGIKNKLSKSLFLNKTQFETDSYEKLISSIEQELQIYNLINDSTIDIMNSHIFNLQINFVKDFIKEKNKLNNKEIYKNVDNIKRNFSEAHIPPHLENNAYNYKDFHNYYEQALKSLRFLKNLETKKLEFNHFLNSEVLKSFDYLNTVSDNFRKAFKNEIETKKIKNKK